jgi:hypothetical protein
MRPRLVLTSQLSYLSRSDFKVLPENEQSTSKTTIQIASEAKSFGKELSRTVTR